MSDTPTIREMHGLSDKPRTFDQVAITVADPDTIRSWSFGEVVNPETINYRTFKPEKGGLFCERIFGPTRDMECACGKYKRIKHKGITCDRCGVEVTNARVRRERMGHIELAVPVSHIWFYKCMPSRIGLMLDMTARHLERVIYYEDYIVVDPGSTPLEKGAILTEEEFRNAEDEYGYDSFEAGMGAEAIQKMLAAIDLPTLVADLQEQLDNTNSKQNKRKIAKRLKLAQGFLQSNTRPEWMILNVLPVIPPDLRPLVPLEGGRFATSDLNDLYRRVINRNNRLKTLLSLKTPEVIIRNEKRMLQEAVDALFDNGRHGRAVTGAGNRPLKSLSDMLKGKGGRFRQNLLGKRVDYSGRSVIVIGPELKLNQCGLPKKMALILFEPFIIHRLKELGYVHTVRSAKKLIDRKTPEVWDILEEVTKGHPVMLNRAPTLHRLSIQAFEPVLIEGSAIRLHPLVCNAYNADFDGDQMAVHVPLSAEAQAEARLLMLAANNLLKPSDGKPVTVPTQDMILGSYYLTMEKDGEPGEGKAFLSVDEATMAYNEGDIGLHSKIKIRMTKEINGEKVTKLVPTTLGKIIFNNPIPQDLGFIDRSNPENAFNLEVEFLVDKKGLGKIIDKCIKKHGVHIASVMLDSIKAQGYKYSTKSGITVAVCDAIIPPHKQELLEAAEEKVDAITAQYKMGLLSNNERSKRVIKVWEECTNKVSQGIKENLGKNNPIYMMVDSGARGSESQLRQLAGMRGLIANTAGKTIEVPIRANYREGLNVLEYFISSRGARKGLADTALRTADSGYLTRRLVDVSQDVIIREEDCHCHDGIEVYDIHEGKEMIETLQERLTGRFLLEDFVDEKTGELIMPKDKMMTEDDAAKVAAIVNARPNEADRRIKIRSLLTCESDHGVCIKCYGSNLATGEPVTVGEAVGIIAAQSIGEPGTQLTMRTFHTGGIASSQDITQGLPRVEELFEARKPKTLAILAEIDGYLSFREIKKNEHIVITNPETAEEKTYLIPYGFRKKFNSDKDENGNPIFIKKGTALTEGAPNPHDILAINGVNAVHDYLIKEVQKTYRMQGVDINDKHIEVIVRQMMRKLKVDEPGSTELLPGATIEKSDFNKENKRVSAECEAEGKEFTPATCEPVLLGITKASLATDSFLSAASFQETTRVLTDAAIKGKTDPLIGLKENVIIGKLLPSGTGMKCYSEVELEKTYSDDTNPDEPANEPA